MCGAGVTSEMAPTSRPAACNERIAVSRPEPGPLTNTSTFFRPCSCARRAAASAASCAANGVDLREPLYPTWPEDDQEITAPVGSVIEIIVLLKVLLMNALPTATLAVCSGITSHFLFLLKLDVVWLGGSHCVERVLHQRWHQLPNRLLAMNGLQFRVLNQDP